jgi:methylmalonyl-CoA/ethylmalonyl-CoA epimerase
LELADSRTQAGCCVYGAASLRFAALPLASSVPCGIKREITTSPEERRVSQQTKVPAPIPIEGFAHVAMAVPDLPAAVAFYREKFGCTVSEIMELESQGVRMAYVNIGATRIELMEPLGPDSHLVKYLERNPAGGIHHICLTVDDVPAAAEGAEAAGLRVLGGKPAKGYFGQELFFMHPKDTLGALIEIEPNEEHGSEHDEEN